MADEWRTPETDALIDAILRLDDREEAERFLRDLCTLGELHDMAQRWAVVRLLDDGPPLRRDLEADRRQHRDDHPDRVLAQPRRGRLPRACSTRSKATTARRHPLPAGPIRQRAMRERLRLAIPNKGRLLEPTLALLHDAGPRVRGARPQPRRARPEPPARHPVRADERRRRVRRRRRGRRSGSPAATSSPSPASTCRSPRARLRPLPARRRGPGRRAVRGASTDLDGLRVATSHPNVDPPRSSPTRASPST